MDRRSKQRRRRAIRAIEVPKYQQTSSPSTSTRATLAALRRTVDALRPDASEFIRTREALFRRGTTRADKIRLQAGIVWAAAANTIPAAFWSLAYLLRDPAARAEISAELVDHSPDDPKRLPKLQSAVSDALRLCSASLTIREARRDFEYLTDALTAARNGLAIPRLLPGLA